MVKGSCSLIRTDANEVLPIYDVCQITFSFCYDNFKISSYLFAI